MQQQQQHTLIVEVEEQSDALHHHASDPQLIPMSSRINIQKGSRSHARRIRIHTPQISAPAAS
jgi:hypothetical protein